jgi:hypothetical protein
MAISLRAACLWAGIWTQDFQNTKQSSIYSTEMLDAQIRK